LNENTFPQNESEIEPLTSRDRYGELYRRPPEVIAEINWALRLFLAELIACAKAKDIDDSKRLREETLAYFTRRFFQRGEQEPLGEIEQTLFDRSVRYIRWKLPKFDEQTNSDTYMDVLIEMVARIVNFPRPDGTPRNGDFYQVRFWLALEKLVLDECRALIKSTNREQDVAPQNDEEDEDFDNTQVDISDRYHPQVAMPIERQILLAEGLSQLNGLVQMAFLLHNFYEFPVSSNDPEKMTVASVMKKSPRTIHYLLTEAEKILTRWRGSYDTHTV
jgi:hypothetical protein